MTALSGMGERPLSTGGGDLRTLPDDRISIGGERSGDADRSKREEGGWTIGVGRGGSVPRDDLRCLCKYVVERGGDFVESRTFNMEAPRGSWLEKELERLELGDALGEVTGGVYGIRLSTVRCRGV